jgi:hypothetical protein
MTLNTPHGAEFHTVKKLINRMTTSKSKEKVSTDDRDVPEWQRQIVWTPVEKGLLAYSIINNYPIGMIVLWKKKNGIRVPIDGRQRLDAIKEFYEGRVAIPDGPGIPEELKNAKYKILDGDEEKGFKQLELDPKETFEDYELNVVQYDEIDEAKAMDIFVKLQGGKSLTKTEVRAALGGKLCDFVSHLTSGTRIIGEEDESEEEEPPARHPFFRKLVNVRNIRKAHRNICDILLHEYLYPDQDKHWTNLQSMYFERARTLTDNEQADFKTTLGRFQRSVEIVVKRKKVIRPELRSAFLILTFFKVWRELDLVYALPSKFSFADMIRDFEEQRSKKPHELPWVDFSSALSNAGYAKHRIKTRHDILMSYILRHHPSLVPKDRRQRAFTDGQKIAIWNRAGMQCEWKSHGKRCAVRFVDFREADADHIVKWKDGGPTSINNGRLLCKHHNRARK